MAFPAALIIQLMCKYHPDFKGQSPYFASCSGKKKAGTPDGMVYSGKDGRGTFEWKTLKSTPYKTWKLMVEYLLKCAELGVPAHFEWPTDDASLSRETKIICQVMSRSLLSVQYANASLDSGMGPDEERPPKSQGGRAV